MENQTSDILVNEKLSFDRFREEVLNDYKIACISREVSLVARKEVLTGKAKFGIFRRWQRTGPGSHGESSFKQADFRSGYYRDQTFMFAIGPCYGRTILFPIIC